MLPTARQMEPFFSCEVVSRGAPQDGALLFGVSMETSDFFKDEAKRCRDNAGVAATKADQESWLNMASRWEELLRPSDETDASALRPMRTIYNKNPRRQYRAS